MKLSTLIKLLQDLTIEGNDPEVFIDLDMGEFGNPALDIVSQFDYGGSIYLTTEVIKE